LNAVRPLWQHLP